MKKSREKKKGEENERFYMFCGAFCMEIDGFFYYNEDKERILFLRKKQKMPCLFWNTVVQ